VGQVYLRASPSSFYQFREFFGDDLFEGEANLIDGDVQVCDFEEGARVEKVQQVCSSVGETPRTQVKELLS
jgi:hypothetical protein